ncbi:putative membrane protein [Rhodococcus wratislaviensis]|uniref:Inner membrane protein n=1 Tax=Rhodococcus wratislaviensis TaxID=44752 RepID=A0AB38F9G0_RHOWR|nr:DUF202 domain-containing protein [Rhodococcus wratislaviensis]REE73099.1 putative membrane protein [Rhodococcus wratislaviensis]SPZ37889.1 inner membrane protein [Rhodococcus wratislaviensis]
MTKGRRRPGPFRVGEDPDPRFTLANERTFLAWIRTALGMIAGAVGFETFGPELPPMIHRLLVTGLLVAAVVITIGCFLRWMGVESAMRRGHSLPAPALAPMLVGVLAGAGTTLALVFAIR